MKNLFTLLFGILLFGTASAQTPQLAWAKTFSNTSAATDSTSVMKLYTADNSVYIAGTSDAFGKGNDIVLIKRDFTTGDIIWSRTYDGFGGNDQATDLVIDQTTGDVYLTGKSMGNSGYDVATLKYSSLGELIWIKRWDNSNISGDDIPINIGIDSKQNIHIGGYTYSGNSEKDDLLIISYDKNGKLLSGSSTYGSSGIDLGIGSYGNHANEITKKAKITSTGHVLLAGDSSLGTSNSGYSMVYVSDFELGYYGFSSYYTSACLSYPHAYSGFPKGTIISAPDDFNYLQDMDADNSDNAYLAYLCDTIKGTGQGYSLRIAKVNANGCMEWEKKYGKSPNAKGFGIKSIKADSNGNVYVAGFEKNSSGNLDWFVIKYNSTGGFVWRKSKSGTANGNDVPYTIAFDNFSNPIVAGCTVNAGTNQDITVVKYNKLNGSEVFTLNYDSNNRNECAYNVVSESGQSILVNGLIKTATQTPKMIALKYCFPPGAAEAIVGSVSVCQGQTGVTYTIPEVENATSYKWTLPSGATGTSLTNSISVSFGTSISTGSITVKGVNDCSEGTLSKLEITMTQPSLPKVETSEISAVTFSKATGGGLISFAGCPAITERGICWSTSPNPTISDARTTSDLGTNEFNCSLTGLIPAKTYYVRAYATNTKGTVYGEQKSFSTQNSNDWNNVTDVDGNTYTRIVIGSHVWMGQNLKTTKYNDGSAIPLATDNSTWKNSTTPAYCWYNNDIINKNPNGALYNWYAVNTKKLCPKGWHVPTYEEWKTLEDYLITSGYNYDGTTSGNKIAKSLASTTSWISSTFIGTPGNSDYSTKRNISGFSAVPSGTRGGYDGIYNNMGKETTWWSSTEVSNAKEYVWISTINNSSTILNQSGAQTKMFGFSVRCLCDEPVSFVPAGDGKIEGNTEVCSGSVNVIYTVNPIAGASSYKWTLPTGATGTSITNSISVIFSNTAISGNISVKGHNDFGDGTSSSLSVIVNAKPVTPTVSLVTGNALHSNAGTGNQWYNQTGAINGATTQDFTPNSSGDYYVVVSINGCTSNASNTMKFIPTGINPTESNKSIKVYPNPVTNELTIELQGNTKQTNFEIINSLGQAVFTGNLLEKTVVETSSFTPGMYLIKLGSGKTFEFKKIIKN